MSKAVGIDLGTTNSLVAVVENNQAKTIPDSDGKLLHSSVVSFHPNGKILIGNKAKERKVIDPLNSFFSTKRLIGRDFSDPEVQKAAKKYPYKIVEGPHGVPLAETRGKQYTLVELGAMIIKYLKTVAENHLQQEITDAVITVPANFNDVQRSSTKICGSIAGLNVTRVINEPTAAALAYGFGQQLNERIAVYDFGGGTFDITILQVHDNVFEVISTAGDSFLGGDDIDNRLVEKINDAFLQMHHYDLNENPIAMQRVRNVAEQIKCQLSTRPEVAVKIKELTYGPGGQPLDIEFSITRDAFNNMIDDIVTKTIYVCDEAFKLGNITASQIDNILLVGGTTRIPLVREKLQQYFNQPLRSDINPDEVVALGAAIQAHALMRSQKKAEKKVFPLPGSVREEESKAEWNDFEFEETKKASQVDIEQTFEFEETKKASKVDIEKAFEFEETKKASKVDIEHIEETTDRKAPSFFSTEELEEMPFSSGKEAIGVQIEGVPALPSEMSNYIGGSSLLLDVTPRAIGIETVDGYYEIIIDRNVPLPVEQIRLFTTTKDNQTVVKVKIYQGESKKVQDNTLLGELELSGIRETVRGAIKIEVKFEINTDGIVNVSAKDIDTGDIAYTKVTIFGGLSQDEVAKINQKYNR